MCLLWVLALQNVREYATVHRYIHFDKKVMTSGALQKEYNIIACLIEQVCFSTYMLCVQEVLDERLVWRTGCHGEDVMGFERLCEIFRRECGLQTNVQLLPTIDI